MKRARKRSSFLNKKQKNSDIGNNDFEIIDTETEYADNFESDSTADDPTDFAVPDEVLAESLAERISPDVTITEDTDEPDDFAVPDELLAETLTEYASTDIANAADADKPDDFAMPELEFAEAISDECADEYADIPEDEIPFSTPDYIDDEDVIEATTPEPNEQRIKWEKKMRRRRITTVFASIFILLIATSFALLGIDFSDGTTEDFLEPVDTATGKINILLLGIDQDGARSDSIMLLNYDFDTHAINLMSIPRDTKMYITDRRTTRKITEVHGMHDGAGNMYGASAVAESVTALTGVPVNYYIEFSFTAIDKVMDILGPVTFDVPDIEGGGRGMNYDDDWQDLHIHLKPGLQELSGNQIQQFLRYRKSNYGTADGSDTSRVGRQQELLKAIIDQKINIAFILKVPEIFKEMKSQIKTNFSLKDVFKYAGYLKDVSSANMSTFILPGADVLQGAWYFNCDYAATAEIITNSFGYEVTADELSNHISLTGRKPPEKNNTKSETTKKPAASKTTSNKSSSAEKKVDDEEKPSATKKDDVTTSSKDTSTDKKDNTGSKTEAPSSSTKDNSADKPTDNGTSKNDSTPDTKKDTSGSSDNTDSSSDEIISLD